MIHPSIRSNKPPELEKKIPIHIIIVLLQKTKLPRSIEPNEC